MTKFSVRTLLAALAITLLWRPALAMEFQRAGKVIHGLGGTSEAIQASGVIEHGDAQKFLTFVRVNGAARTDNWTVELSSPGGNLIEGIALGQAFRNAGMVTSVRRGNVCMSACAIAYLGGVYVGAAGEGVGRQLEYGATLGFHGFKSDNDGVGPGRWDGVSIEEARAAAVYDLALERMTEEQYRAFDAIPSLDTASQDEFLRPFTARAPDADIEAKLRAWGFSPA